MSAAQSFAPPALVSARPKYLAPSTPLRGGTPSKLRLKSRQDARDHGAETLRTACDGVSDVELGRNFASSDAAASVAGARIRSGALSVSFGEVVALVPLGPMLSANVELLRARMAHELVHGELDDATATLMRLIVNRLSEAADLARSLRTVKPNR